MMVTDTLLYTVIIVKYDQSVVKLMMVYWYTTVHGDYNEVRPVSRQTEMMVTG